MRPRQRPFDADLALAVRLAPEPIMKYDDYDVIVTGAGIAGLMAACFLARAGARVLVLEANHQPGGLMAGIWRHGYYFDVGDQSFEDLGIVFALLGELGLYDATAWRRSRYQIRMPDLDVVVESLAQVEAAFVRAFPAEAVGLARVFRQHHATSALLSRVVGADVLARAALGSLGARFELLRILAPHAHELPALWRQDFGAWYEEQMAPSGLRDLLATCGYSEMNVLVASGFWHLWANDYWYPQGGLAAFFAALVARLQSLGGEIAYRECVTRYVVERGAVRGVLTAKGDAVSARAVVHTGSLHEAVFELIGEAHFARAFVRRLNGAALSDAMVSLYLGLDVPAEELRQTMRVAHLFYFPSYAGAHSRLLDDPEHHRVKFLELTSHSLDEPALAPPGKTSLVVQAFSSGRWGGRWGQDGPSAGRKARYRDRKRAVADELLTLLAPLVPQLRERIEWLDVGAPASATRFTRNPEGATCGFALHPRHWPRRHPLAGGLRSPLRNLYFAGHYALWPGTVPTAALSGKLAAQLVLRRDLG